jgi:hypothetical protein
VVARKFIRLAEAVAVELEAASESVEFLSQASDAVLLRASERCGLLLSPLFRREVDRLAAIRRRLDDVREAQSSGEWAGPEDEDALIRRQIRRIAFRNPDNMGPTDRRTTADALRTLLNRKSRERNEKPASTKIERPAEFNREPVMVSRSILPAGPTPQDFAERAVLAERSRPAPTFEERLRQRAFEDQARMQAQYDRIAAEAIRWAARCAAQAAHYRPEDTPRRIGMPGIGGM